MQKNTFSGVFVQDEVRANTCSAPENQKNQQFCIPFQTSTLRRFSKANVYVFGFPRLRFRACIHEPNTCMRFRACIQAPNARMRFGACIQAPNAHVHFGGNAKMRKRKHYNFTIVSGYWPF